MSEHAQGLISMYLRGCLEMGAERRHYRALSRRGIAGLAAWLLLACGPVAAAEIARPGEELVLSIDEAVDLALERNRELAEARLIRTEADKQASEAWGEIFPQIDFSARYARNISPAVSFVPANVFDPTAPEGEFLSLQFGADNSWQSALTLRQPLFYPGAVVGLGAAKRFQRLQREMVRGRAQQVVTRVRLLCYDLLLRAEEVRLTERSLERLRQALEETRGRARAGLASEYDVLRLEVELANLEPLLLRARNAVASVRRQLAVELAVDDPGRLWLSESGALTEATAALGPPPPTTDLVEAAPAQRSDVRQLEHTAELRRVQVRREKAEYLPTVSFFATWDVQAQQNGRPDFFGTEETRATSKIAGVSVELPLFTGLQRDARIDQRQAVLRQAQIQAQLARHQATAQVRDLAAALDEAGQRERGQQLAVSQAQRGFDIAIARYREGLGSQLEVTDAEVALRQSEFNMAQAVHDRLASQARLDLAIGRVAPVDEEIIINSEEME